MTGQVTHGILLARTNYGEADRIITVITPDFGKLKLMARGVRKVKSKLAGGIELFSVSSITFIKGKKDIGTLVSTRLQTHYNHIVEDIDRTMLGYEVLKTTNKMTQDNCESDYYMLLLRTLGSLNNNQLNQTLIYCWFLAQLIKLSGNMPNLKTTTSGETLQPNSNYQFDYQEMGFFESSGSAFSSNHIKMLRLLMSEDVEKLQMIQSTQVVLVDLTQLLKQAMLYT